jgi:hypothetical protein
MRSGALIGVGGALAGIGATFAAAYWIYGLSQKPRISFWSLSGYASVACLALGLVILVVALFIRDNDAGAMSQRGGDRSINIQSGRDTSIGED